MEAFKQLKKYAVVIYIDTENPKSREKLSPVVIGALNAKSMGNTIPKAVVTSADQKTFMASMTYKSMNDAKSFRDANKQVKTALAGDVIERPKDVKCVWSISGSGRFYRGEFVEIKNGKLLVLKSPEGKTFNVPLGKLSAGTQAYARVLAGGGAKEEASGEKREPESWTNSKGKEIRARFVSLKDGKISLEKEDGKVVEFSLTLLSERSQSRAKELAGE